MLIIIPANQKRAITLSYLFSFPVLNRDVIDALEVSPRQTQVAIVEFSTNANIDIGLHDYGSKTRLKCAVNNIRQKGNLFPSEQWQIL